MGRLLGRSVAVAMAASFLVVIAGSAAHAVKAVVTNCSNDTDLRAKLAQLQTKRSGKLKFNCGSNPTIVLSGGPLTITKKIKILGGPAGVTLSGGNSTTLLTVAAGGKATLSRVILTRGFNSTGNGGAITNLGKLTLDFCLVSDNQAVGSGGAILSLGALTIVNSNFTGNKAANGGALFPRFAAGKTTIRGSLFEDNETTSLTDGWGGAILIWDGASVDVADTVFKDNVSRNGGGAIYVFGAGSKLESFATNWDNNLATAGKGGAVYNQGTFDSLGYDLFEANKAVDGGAVYNESSFSVVEGVLERNDAALRGGALYNVGNASAYATTFEGNNTVTGGGNGGAVANDGTFGIANSTVSANSSNGGGGIANTKAGAFAQLTHVTVTGNAAGIAGGGLLPSFGTFQVANSIVGANLLGGDCTAAAGATGIITSQGFNLSSDGSCSFDELTDIENTDPMLGPLQANGGFTRTHMPAADSEAVDNAGGLLCFGSDQRPTDRPQGAACDIGAVERCKRGKPAAFALLSPANGASLPIKAPLDWSDASCATRYLVSLRRGSSTGEVLFTDMPVFASRVVFPFYALRPDTYAWRVKACQGNKCRPSPWWTLVPVTITP